MVRLSQEEVLRRRDDWLRLVLGPDEAQRLIRPAVGHAMPDAKTEPEIEVTPEMIEAGKEALIGVSLVEDDWGSVVIEVYRAMARVHSFLGKR